MKARAALFGVGAVPAAAVLAWGLGGLRGFGHVHTAYADAVVALTEPARHATNAITTVVMDVRAVDTASEELLLLAAVVGVLLVLRITPRDREVAPRRRLESRANVRESSAVVATCRALLAPAALLGIYIVMHGQLTPGGGFQGGVLLAVPSVLVYLGTRDQTYERFHDSPPWEIVQAIAICVFLGFGYVALARGDGFLGDFLPLGVTGTVYSSGTIEALNVVAGIAVDTAIVLLAVSFLGQLNRVRDA